MIYKRIDKRYPYMAMLCELIDKYFVETLLCSGGGKNGYRRYTSEGEIYNEVEGCNSYAFVGIE